jgi:hypothetical protein
MYFGMLFCAPDCHTFWRNAASSCECGIKHIAVGGRIRTFVDPIFGNPAGPEARVESEAALTGKQPAKIDQILVAGDLERFDLNNRLGPRTSRPCFHDSSKKRVPSSPVA